MRYVLWLSAALILTGCSFTNTTTEIKNFAKCYVHKIPAPFWVCYQSDFMGIGKVYTKKVTRLVQEEAYSVGLTNLTTKLQSRTLVFLKKIGITNKDEIAKVLNKVKSFVIVNSLQGNTWYSSKDHILYVQVTVDKKSFKRFIFSLFKNIKQSKLQTAFDEVY